MLEWSFLLICASLIELSSLHCTILVLVVPLDILFLLPAAYSTYRKLNLSSKVQLNLRGESFAFLEVLRKVCCLVSETSAFLCGTISFFRHSRVFILDYLGYKMVEWKQMCVIE